MRLGFNWGDLITELEMRSASSLIAVITELACTSNGARPGGRYRRVL